MKINVERMRYKTDSLSFWMCIFGLVFDVVQFCKTYANCYLQTLTGKAGFNYWNFGADIIYNIIFMLIVFYMSEELKTYHRKWSIVSLLIGAAQVVRIFWFPRNLLQNEFIGEDLLKTITLFYILSAACFFAAAIISFVKSTMLYNFLKGKKA